MKIRHLAILSLSAVLISGVPGLLNAGMSLGQNAGSGSSQPSGKTADNQPNDRADRMTTAKIRRAIIADKGLSLKAHNVKIITISGQVTLEGEVKTEAEKQRVVVDAASIVQMGNITNNLTVHP